ncbi:TonB-dependent receptor [Undibacterium sp. LX40W]|uniref:TonB-dependent receptor n=1 Tax=Undibacterium nitidum TaxID=2762298 RepID=A0A923HKA1_9BURK|nr:MULTISPECIES: TonB-dependent receptor [Undibacterium]MBC3881200.1 TonB-dependent receptor [Undibacterium nitidum]MBC3890067.1 TonB-dependent receptor [Undibacterium sp. LX40W]
MKKKQSVIRGLLLTSILASPMTVIHPVLAQTQGTDTPPESGAKSTADSGAQGSQLVVVTGIRSSLESARNQKRNSSQFVDAIVAEDMGKLPDKNVAESLARVSGVQVDRGIGEGTSISVRGLRQNVTLFNGREILDSTGRGGTGIDQLGTSTYGLMALVPSEIISQLEVTKLAGANQISGALGGLVDIRTRMPLDGPETQFAFKTALTRDRLPGKTGEELFGLAAGKFANNTVGVLVGVSAENRSLSQQGLDTFSGYRSYTDANFNPSKTVFGNQDVRIQEIREDRSKRGVNATVQWRPSKSFELIGDTFYSKLNSNRDRFWLSFNPTTSLTNAVYSANNVLLSGQTKSAVLSNTEAADVDSDIMSSALRSKFTLTENLKGSAEISTGRSTSSYHQLYFRLQPIATITPTIDFDLGNGAYGTYAVNGINLLDPDSLRHTILFDNLYRASSENKSFRTDFTLKFPGSFFSSVDFGARLSNLDSTQNPLRTDVRPAGGIPANQLGNFLTTYSNTSINSGLPSSYLIASRAVFTSCSAFTAFPVISQNSQCLDPSANTNSLAGTFEIKERFTEAYAKVNFETEVGEMPVGGNLGYRLLRREMDSIGNLIGANGAATPNTYRRNDSEALPSGVTTLELNRETILRAGAAKVVAFPNTVDLNNGISLSNNAVFQNGVQTSPGTGSGGAPGLDPFRATQFDLSLERYFGKQGMASVGLFRKNISSFIVQRQSPESYGGINYLINRKVNGEGATMQGAEMLVQMPFSFLPKAFDGLGMMATYSYIDSKTPIRDVTNRQLPFPGLSKNNVNLVTYYESGPFGVRLAYNWRDAYLVSLSAANTGIYNDTYRDLSLSFKYDYSTKVSFSLEGSNLLNSKQRTYDGTSEALRTNNIFGSIFKLSMNVKL